MPHAGGTSEGVTLGLDAAAALLKKQETCAADMWRFCARGNHVMKSGRLKMPVSFLLNLQGSQGAAWVDVQAWVASGLLSIGDAKLMIMKESVYGEVSRRS